MSSGLGRKKEVFSMSNGFDCSCWVAYPNGSHKKCNGKWKCVDKFECVHSTESGYKYGDKTKCRRKEEKRMQNGILKINNLPQYALVMNYVVARRDAETKELWFWGAFDTEEESIRVASEIGGEFYPVSEVKA